MTEQTHLAPAVRPESARYAEELRRSSGKKKKPGRPINGHAGWDCDAGASALAQVVTPRPGKVDIYHGVIYACPDHQAAAEEQITAAGYTCQVEPAPPSHQRDPWPCGHVTLHSSAAAEVLFHPANG